MLFTREPGLGIKKFQNEMVTPIGTNFKYDKSLVYRKRFPHLITWSKFLNKEIVK